MIDSHTEGEPTRVVIGGLPDLGPGDMAARLRRLGEEFDAYRRMLVLEPRGHDAWVAAILQEPTEPGHDAGVLFVNNAGPLGMCGHGTIGVVRTLQHLGRLPSDEVRLETPVGSVSAKVLPDGRVAIRNVASYLGDADVEVLGLRGDVAWGGNWFFIAPSPIPIVLENLTELTALSWQIRHELASMGHGKVDHIELFGPSEVADCRNFVLCPGGAYDRSPCGTGTSAKLATLYAHGRLALGESYRVESILGGIFEGSLEETDAGLIPTIRGRAFITAESTLLIEDADPFGWGIGS